MTSAEPVAAPVTAIPRPFMSSGIIRAISVGTEAAIMAEETPCAILAAMSSTNPGANPQRIEVTAKRMVPQTQNLFVRPFLLNLLNGRMRAERPSA